MWRSVFYVNGRHNSVSKRSYAAGLHGISQKDLSMTLFGFAGYAVIRGEYIGIHNATNEELHDFIHLWRVIGYLMGVEDKYNICRDSVEETKQIFELLLTQLKPELEKLDENFMNMSSYVTEGLWPVNQFLSQKALICYIYRLMTVAESDQLETEKLETKPLIKMDLGERIIFNLYCTSTYCLQYTPYRVFMNYIQYFNIWLMQNFPFVAYFKFGYNNSHVSILKNSKRY